ncbi:MAG: peptidoglycan DD-metalloendopeptidase family protein [Elusimicrobiota bacterium]
MMKLKSLILDIVFVVFAGIVFFSGQLIARSGKTEELPMLNNSLLVTNPVETLGEDARQKIFRELDYLIITKHKVQQGEHIWNIAKKYGVTSESLRSTNYMESTFLKIGQELWVHNKNGLVHKVKPNETLESIADKYRCSLNKICEMNGLVKSAVLEPGTMVFVPNAVLRFPMFVFPVNGRMSSRYGYRRHPIFGGREFHRGLDISAKRRTPIYAAREGKVLFAGVKSGYGNCVIIKHPDSFVSYYGHMQNCSVKTGQWVNKKQVIGKVGSSGWSTGPHLHFELHKNGKAVNPKRYVNN